MMSWLCGCGSQIDHKDRPRDKGGRLLKHCGCKGGKRGRHLWKGKSKHSLVLERVKRADGKWVTTPESRRLARLCALPGYKPVKHDAHVRAWRANEAEKTQARMRDRLSKHDAHVRLWRSDDARFARWRTKHDPKYVVNMRMRVQIRKALRGGKGGRRWESILGYTLEELAAHLERMLPKGMTLDKALNAGWHIDHIVPKSLYDVTIEDELRAAWCMSNLRLITAKENMEKSDSYVYLC